MPGSFQAINTASQALRAFQRELDVTGHNIANVDTPGYSRQVATLQSFNPTTFQDGHAITLGGGVAVSAVNRVRDMFLQARRQSASADLGQSTAMQDGLSRVEATLQEPGGSGIADSITKFFNSWSSLSASPNDPTSKSQVQAAGQTLADKVRGEYLALDDQKAQQSSLVTNAIQGIQSQVNTIAKLNDQIRQEKAIGAEPNDLMDQRDQAVQTLSGMADIQTQAAPDGSVNIYMNQLTLVDSGGARTVPNTWDATTGTLSDANGTYEVRSGQLKGLFDSINKIKSYQTNLDNLANNLRTQVNAIHQTGVNSAGGTGLSFFNDVPVTNPVTPQTGAINFDLDPGVKANAQTIAAGQSGNASDGSIALALSKLRDTNIGNLNQRSFNEYFSDLVGQVGTDVSTAKASMDTQTSVAQQIDSQIQSVSGVSLDDEMSNMLRFQRSYQAAAKALSIFDQTTSDLINMLNR